MRRERKNNRLDYYDYSLAGWYFVTFCTEGRINWFGRIINGRMELNGRGRIAEQTWRNIPRHYRRVGIDEFVIMPNHIHGIVVIGDAVDGGLVGTGPWPVRDDIAMKIDYLHKKTGGCSVGTAQCAVPTTPHPIAPTTTNPVPTIPNPIIPMPNPTITTSNQTVKFSKYGLLSRVIKSYKEFVGRRIRAKFPDINFAWQRSFYDHIIRDEQDYQRIVKYIKSNPRAWRRDRNNQDA